MSSTSPLPSQRLFKLENFGHSIERPAYLYRPTHVEQIKEIFELAAENNIHIALRGAGRSYGDAALASGGIVLDLQRMNRVLDWNPETGVITVEPGVTIERSVALHHGRWLVVAGDARYDAPDDRRLPGGERPRQEQLEAGYPGRPCDFF